MVMTITATTATTTTMLMTITMMCRRMWGSVEVGGRGGGCTHCTRHGTLSPKTAGKRRHSGVLCAVDEPVLESGLPNTTPPREGQHTRDAPCRTQHAPAHAGCGPMIELVWREACCRESPPPPEPPHHHHHNNNNNDDDDNDDDGDNGQHAVRFAATGHIGEVCSCLSFSAVAVVLLQVASERRRENMLALQQPPHLNTGVVHAVADSPTPTRVRNLWKGRQGRQAGRQAGAREAGK
jgi:hypothetical protein